MPPCHTVPFIRPGVVVDTHASDTPAESSDRATAETDERCDYCGSASLEWRKCKLVCANCRQINKSCADL